MRVYLSSIKVWVVVLVLVIIAQGALLGCLWRWQHQDEQTLLSQTNQLTAQVASASGFSGYTHVVVEPSQNKVYIPELRLALPLDATTLQLMYSLRYEATDTGQPTGADITTQSVAAYVTPMLQIRSCSSTDRIQFTAKPNPFNPEEKTMASVAEGNGQTLQVYSYHLASCAKEWQFLGADIDAIAAEFKQATTY